MDGKMVHIKNILKEVIANPPGEGEALDEFLEAKAKLIFNYSEEKPAKSAFKKPLKGDDSPKT